MPLRHKAISHVLRIACSPVPVHFRLVKFSWSNNQNNLWLLKLFSEQSGHVKSTSLNQKCTRALALERSRECSKLDGRKLATLRASYTYIASLCSTSLLKLSKKSFVSVFGSAHDRASEYSRLDMKKCGELEACPPPSESFTAFLRSVNLAVLIKKYDRRANCLLS